VHSTPGLRTGFLIVDDGGYIFTPPALYLEADQHNTEAPNALCLSRDQVTEALARFSPAAKTIAMALAKSPEQRERIRDQAVEVRSHEVTETELTLVGIYHGFSFSLRYFEVHGLQHDGRPSSTISRATGRPTIAKPGCERSCAVIRAMVSIDVVRKAFSASRTG